ncbi:MAG: hypothetical protein IPM34_10825 [Saprospiraceae bacterium]|nr:hypothetical protein [Saprospiraceae bacterium]
MWKTVFLGCILRKLLIISYYWPPSGGSGVQRWLYFVKYLRECGWEPVIYTVENGEFPFIDNGLLSMVPNGVEVIRRRIWEPYSFFKNSGVVRMLWIQRS